jgi:hypothetical protein
MAEHATDRPLTRWTLDAEQRHRLRWFLTAFIAAASLVVLAVYGYSYYQMPLVERPRATLHALLRPSGSLGLRLGILGGVLFLGVYLYPLRKRWSWLRQFGNTRHWLDFHVLLGVTGPLLINFHSSFKFHGLAGMAFWIMWTVVASGFVGRYFYGQIPRHLDAAEMSLKEMEKIAAELGRQIESQQLLCAADLAPLFRLPGIDEIQAMPVWRALAWMVRIDFSRPWVVSRVRRKTMGGVAKMISLGGVLPGGRPQIEDVIAAARKQSRLSTKILFLDKTRRVFHLWHVVHRPFSYSFLALVLIHVVVVILLGYF